MMAPEQREQPLPTIEERLAFVEGRQQDHFSVLDDLRDTTRDLRADTNRQFAELRADMVRQFADVDRRFEAMNDKIDRHFTWTVGLQVATMIAMLGTVAGALYQ